MDLIKEWLLSGQPTGQPSCMENNFNIGHYMQTVLPNLFSYL